MLDLSSVVSMGACVRLLDFIEPFISEAEYLEALALVAREMADA
jgi:hypothetical protein